MKRESNVYLGKKYSLVLVLTCTCYIAMHISLLYGSLSTQTIVACPSPHSPSFCRFGTDLGHHPTLPSPRSSSRFLSSPADVALMSIAFLYP